MNEFEKQFYEEESFWTEERSQDNLNARRIELTANLIPQECNSILDIGCGNGVLVNYLANKNKDLDRIVGVDRSEAALSKVGTEKYSMDITKLEFDDSEFDCVTSLEVIEHLPMDIYDSAVSEIARVSAKYVIISVPHDENLIAGQTQCPSCKSIFNASLHLRSFTEETMQSLLTSKGFDCLQTEVFFPSRNSVGADFLRKLENRGKEQFSSPICPICGFRNKDFVAHSEKVLKENLNNQSLSNKVKQTFKKFWIKRQYKGYWVVGLYKKIETKN